MDELLRPIALDPAQPQAIAPTDLAQYLRLDQCQRYLRLRLHERRKELNWLPKYRLSLQSIPPMLTIAGRLFEQEIEKHIQQRFPKNTIHCAQRRQQGDPDFTKPDHNHIVLNTLQQCSADTAHVLFQPRLAAQLANWSLSGDADILVVRRDSNGALRILIVDAKSSATAKIEHRLQLACYQRLIEEIVRRAGLAEVVIELGVLYRGELVNTMRSPAEQRRIELERQQAAQLLGVQTACLELVDPAPYLAEIETLLYGPNAILDTIATASFAAVPFHLTTKCDGCLYNEICMRWAATHDDLSLIPTLTVAEKSALQANQINTVQQLALLKEVASDGETLYTPPTHQAKVRDLIQHPVLAPRLNELIYRARAFRRWKGDQIKAPTRLLYRGYGSLPAVSPDLHANLVAIYLDTLYDHTQGMIVMLAALVVGHRNGERHQSRYVINLPAQRPQTLADEERLLTEWINELLQAIVTVADPDTEVPIHLIVPDTFSLQTLLDGLARHPDVIGATALYDLAAQSAGFEAPMVTVLVNERRRFLNDPLAYDSLARLARIEGFDWGECRRTFYRRVFDDLSNDKEIGWYTRRIRFNNQIPLEYAYAAWQALPPPPGRGEDDLVDYRDIKYEQLLAFINKRLEAFAHLAARLPANHRTTKPPFDLTCITQYTRRSPSLADALAEFLLIERYVALVTWGQQHLPPPEQRVLAGVSLLVRYEAEDQDPALLAVLAENERRQALKAELTGQRKRVRLNDEQRQAVEPLPIPDVPLRLRIVLDNVECDLETALRLTGLSPGDKVILAPRWSVDERLPADQQQPFTTTARQLLYQSRATLIELDPNGFVLLQPNRRYSNGDRRFTFPAKWEWPTTGTLYTIESDPNDIYGQRCMEIVNELRGGASNALHQRLAAPASVTCQIPPAALAGHARFVAGLQELAKLNELHPFDTHQMSYIADYSDAPTLVVQGPPGTGKSYTSAFALLARMQGLLSEDRPCRILLSCKTHAATDVLLRKIADVQKLLIDIQQRKPTLFDDYFDKRTLKAPLFRVRPKADSDLPKTVQIINEAGIIANTPFCFVAATPYAISSLLKQQQRYHTDPFADILILDEASQMNLAEACMAAIALHRDGRLIVVGDHRQMPPIVQHEWRSERRRTFQSYRVYSSLFETLLLLDPAPPIVRLAESFRVHQNIAEFLRRAIYEQDGIHYFSQRTSRLSEVAIADDFLAAVLNPAHPLTVIVHDEAQSQDINPFEADLICPLIETLVGQLQLDATNGIGVVVPHRAQRLTLRERLPTLMSDLFVEHEGATVDTVERFQGDERDVIIVSATESDPDYLRTTSGFLLDPRRLNVALSRARKKLILIAARTVFQLFATDEEVFQHAQLWKRLLRDTCRLQLWQGERNGITVEVWGNHSTSRQSPLHECTTAS
ncbi:MAG: AAA domain-containing protein [Chloroflexus sp.]|uniref:AAA domain-containing protein n=1 Tax=Chloroflexus sp. TaxID=1904827 RepID=UPI00404AED8C